jgi:hypothetical protein
MRRALREAREGMGALVVREAMAKEVQTVHSAAAVHGQVVESVVVSVANRVNSRA